MKSIKKTYLSYSVIYQAVPEGGYIAFVPALSGCHTQGETLQETEGNITEAIEIYLESLQTYKQTFPQEFRVLQGKVQVAI